jgi:phage anti-repressor protein
MDYKIIENGLIPVMENKDGENLVDGRNLYKFLEVKDNYTTWIKEKLEKYKFVKDVDFTSFLEKSKKPKGGRPTGEYILTLDTAKEISMVQNNEKGKQARRYFIDVEKRHKKLVKALSKGNSKAGGLNGLLKTLDGVMKDEKVSPWDRADVIKNIAENYGLEIPDKFVKKPKYLQVTLNLPIDMNYKSLV